MTWRPKKGGRLQQGLAPGWPKAQVENMSFISTFPRVFSGKLGLKMEIRNKQIAAN